MEKIYKLHFWFEHGGICLWGLNDNTKNKYGYAVSNKDLPIVELYDVDFNLL